MSSTAPVTRIPWLCRYRTSDGAGLRPTTHHSAWGTLRLIRGRTSRAKNVTPSTFGSQSITPVKTITLGAGGVPAGANQSVSTPLGTTEVDSSGADRLSSARSTSETTTDLSKWR